MSKAGDLLRAEAKIRAETQWKGKLSKTGAWFQAAKWLDENVREPLPEGTWPDLVTLANALRYDFTEGRGHGKQPDWNDCAPNIQKIWLDRARQIDNYIQREIANADS
jgi:hypothetical protein